MIDKLRKKMIWVSGTALIVVFLAVFATIYFISIRQLNMTMDMLCDRISEGGGSFLPFDKEHPRPPDMERFPGFFTAETPFSTRFFVVAFDESGTIVRANTESVSSITEEDACEYANSIYKSAHTRGWENSYRYKIVETPQGKVVVFVDGSMNLATTRRLLITAGSVLLGSMLVIMLLIILLSKRAVRPMVKNYEKQKQFVTDANHELKTPLTLILTNLDILKTEVGENEWLEDIRAEGQRMSTLVNQLTALSRMDEEQAQMIKTKFSFSEMVGDTVSEFMPLVMKQGLHLETDIAPEILCEGDEGALRRVVAILLDNAIKYCDREGSIYLSLNGKRHTTLLIENTCKNIENMELKRLFDRFYRQDKARTASGSFGIGLSLAEAIVHQHHGEISAYQAGTEKIGFKIVLK